MTSALNTGPSDPEMLLRLWESGLGQPDWARGDALERAAFDSVQKPGSLGERNVRLVELHARLFGDRIDLLSHCPACGSVAHFTAECASLAAQMRPAIEAVPHRLDAFDHQVEFRLPDSMDVASASTSAASDDGGFAQRLFDRCVLTSTRGGRHVGVEQLPEAVLDAVSQQMERLDPGASISFGLECPQCATPWQSPVDISGVVWQKIRSAAERLLLDVHLLAHAYGWSEPEVLRLNPLRRAAYLQMVTT